MPTLMYLLEPSSSICVILIPKTLGLPATTMIHVVDLIIMFIFTFFLFFRGEIIFIRIERKVKKNDTN